MVENIIHGGWTLPKVATDEIQIMCDKVKQQIEDKVKRNFEKFETKLYRCEIVNGVQYLVKVIVVIFRLEQKYVFI
ncbi:cystatin-A5 isoform X2 [Octopus bimaculoides]|uniref:cystatin-A5 isoform X2 n=1 Tax=Octopus bimaculoides TaxID=37653 RepID=UPI00071D4675|nr:cystatin-A5 isoform X2 [Octopus bimaculoides]|eukprot:XP_014783690.1 PREDICTED: cystatin-A5-like isoform X2 [Octopus bimaculoides]